MLPFEYQNPVRIIFGAGTTARLKEEVIAWGRNVLLVSYQAQAPLASLLARISGELATTCNVTPFYAVTPNPDIRTIAQGVALAQKANIDVIVGVGGGSAMDAAKAIAAGVHYPEQDLWRMVNSRHDGTGAVAPTQALPTIMLPTLPATGSEMNPCAVVSHDQLQEKSYIWHPCLFPKVAILDPELTYSLPFPQTACGAIDTISHVLEIYINGQDKSDLLHTWQAGIMRTVIDNLPVVRHDPHNADARAELMWCATCALNGWASPGDGWTPMHQVGHVLTTRFGVNHGTSLALMMPAWMDYFHTLKPQRYYNFAREVMRIDPHRKTKAEIAREGIASLRTLIESLGLPTRLSQVGVKDSDLATIVGDVRKISFNSADVLQCNPPVTAAVLLQILESAL